MFIICSSVIYFLAHFEICFWRTSFDGANIYRASQAIIPRIMFFEATLFTRTEGRVRRIVLRRFHAAERYRDQSSFRKLSWIYKSFIIVKT